VRLFYASQFIKIFHLPFLGVISSLLAAVWRECRFISCVCQISARWTRGGGLTRSSQNETNRCLNETRRCSLQSNCTETWFRKVTSRGTPKATGQ
jgi:hypothetical protein